MLTFKKRFWEGIKGGVSVTDRPGRQVVYPSYGYGDQRGILQIYCWAEDARKMGALTHEGAINECLKSIQHLHPDIDVRGYFEGIEEGKKTMTWFWDQHSHGGAFALYPPGQFKNIFHVLRQPECSNRLFFCR
jgi:monoamine oxidase